MLFLAACYFLQCAIWGKSMLRYRNFILYIMSIKTAVSSKLDVDRQNRVMNVQVSIT